MSYQYTIASVISGSKLLVIGTLYSDSANLAESHYGRVGIQELFHSHIYVPRINAVGALTLLEDLSIYR